MAQKKEIRKCIYCGCTEELYLTTDHIKAKSTGGKNSKSNKQTCCILCNQVKSNFPEEDFKEMLIHLRGLKKLKTLVMHTTVSFGIHNQKFKEVEKK
jgi:5-methylcytosine-specific restriction endonuclease McrA